MTVELKDAGALAIFRFQSPMDAKEFTMMWQRSNKVRDAAKQPCPEPSVAITCQLVSKLRFSIAGQ